MPSVYLNNVTRTASIRPMAGLNLSDVGTLGMGILSKIPLQHNHNHLTVRHYTTSNSEMKLSEDTGKICVMFQTILQEHKAARCL